MKEKVIQKFKDEYLSHFNNYAAFLIAMKNAPSFAIEAAGGRELRQRRLSLYDIKFLSAYTWDVVRELITKRIAKIQTELNIQIQVDDYVDVHKFVNFSKGLKTQLALTQHFSTALFLVKKLAKQNVSLSSLCENRECMKEWIIAAIDVRSHFDVNNARNIEMVEAISTMFIFFNKTSFDAVDYYEFNKTISSSGLELSANVMNRILSFDLRFIELFLDPDAIRDGLKEGEDKIKKWMKIQTASVLNSSLCPMVSEFKENQSAKNIAHSVSFESIKSGSALKHFLLWADVFKCMGIDVNPFGHAVEFIHGCMKNRDAAIESLNRKDIRVFSDKVKFMLDANYCEQLIAFAQIYKEESNLLVD